MVCDRTSLLTDFYACKWRKTDIRMRSNPARARVGRASGFFRRVFISPTGRRPLTDWWLSICANSALEQPSMAIYQLLEHGPACKVRRCKSALKAWISDVAGQVQALHGRGWARWKRAVRLSTKSACTATWPQVSVFQVFYVHQQKRRDPLAAFLCLLPYPRFLPSSAWYSSLSPRIPTTWLLSCSTSLLPV